VLGLVLGLAPSSYSTVAVNIARDAPSLRCKYSLFEKILLNSVLCTSTFSLATNFGFILYVYFRLCHVLQSFVMYIVFCCLDSV